VLTGGHPTRLVAFSDDMDGLRKVPDNVPNKDLLSAHLQEPLSRIPDPFGKFESFAHHNNAMLREFLDRFGFDYNSSRARSLQFRRLRRSALACCATSTRSWHHAAHAARGTPQDLFAGPADLAQQRPGAAGADRGGRCRGHHPLVDVTGEVVEQSILGGKSKLQWKVDWAMRWVALGVDYEMCGKDLTDSVTQSGRIAKCWRRRPEGLIYELFLDEGEKISKSKGNGLTIEQWLDYGSEESLGFYLFREPKSAKSLHVGIIPRAVDEYWQFREKLASQPIEQQLGNPVWHLLRTNGEQDGAGDKPVTYGLCSTWSACSAPMPRASRSGPILPTMWPMPIRRPPRARCAGDARSPTIAISSPPRWCGASPKPAKRQHWPRWTRNWPPPATMPRQKNCKTSSTRSARTRTMALKACATGSRRCMKPCSARRRAAHGQLHRALWRGQHAQTDRQRWKAEVQRSRGARHDPPAHGARPISRSILPPGSRRAWSPGASTAPGHRARRPCCA
jgi:hypothetical protein